MLKMDPPYQRRSVWNDTYREQFIDTILLDYPVPAIFLFARIDEEGNARYELVDGKQRLMTVFDFIVGELTVSEVSPVAAFRGKTFASLPPESKIAFFEYDFPVEYLPTNNEAVINDIFERLNRNTAKLTAQELRHAKFSGLFITQAESLTDWMATKFTRPFPRINEQSKRQMKDVEIVATLLLFLEEGPRGYSALDLDSAFSKRESEWEEEQEIVDEFRSVVQILADLVNNPAGQFLSQSRFRNQADFYSLLAGIAELRRQGQLPEQEEMLPRLEDFNNFLENDKFFTSTRATDYYNAARSASNDPGPRKTRIGVIKDVLLGVDIRKTNG
jgi:hypothetical protein